MTQLEHFLDTEDLHPIDLVETLAEQHEWDFDRVAEDQIAMAIEGQWRTYSITLAWSSYDETLRMVSTFEMEPPEERLPALYEVLNRANDTCWTGAFSYWRAQKLMVYRYGSAVSGVPAGLLGGPHARRGDAGCHCRGLWPRLVFAQTNWGMAMDLTTINTRGLVLLGCGKMGSGLLEGWLAQGVAAGSVYVIDPKPSEWVTAQGVHLNAALPDAPALVVIAVKPQMMGDALPSLQSFGADTVYLSIAAGTPIAAFEHAFGPSARIIRSIPNTPAAIGMGITGIVGNEKASEGDMDLAEALLHAVGEVVRLNDEEEIDAVTGVSGSGPAYVFHLIETLAAAGEAQGLSAEVSMKLAKATVAGAGQLAIQANETPAQLRVNVTSPNGTTQAALEVLMDEERGFPNLLTRAVAAASDRGRELRG